MRPMNSDAAMIGTAANFDHIATPAADSMARFDMTFDTIFNRK